MEGREWTPSGLSALHSPLSTAFAIVSLLISSLPAWALERFPPPDFSSGYQLPKTMTPPPRAEFFNYLDIGLLLAALLAASYFALYKRSRRGVAGVAIFSLVYFGFYRHGCICPIGAIQNVALSIVNSGYALPMVAAVFFLLPLVFALFAGRVFCGGVCPLGAAQDVALVKAIKIPQWLAHCLGLLPWIYLGGAVFYVAMDCGFLICQYDPFVAFFRLGGSNGMLAFGAAMLAIGVVVGRPYCRFLCPYGALLRLISPLAKWRVTVTPADCVQCKLCEDACPFGEIRYPTPQDGAIKRHEGKSRLAALLIALPVMIVLGAGLGRLSSYQLSRLHPTVQLAERIYLEDTGKVKGTINESEAFRKLGLPTADVYRRAVNIEKRFRIGSLYFGGWIGLVVGLKLIGLSIRRRRTDYEADSAGCVACGRCYWSCPVERARLGDPEAIKLLEEMSL